MRTLAFFPLAPLAAVALLGCGDPAPANNDPPPPARGVQVVTPYTIAPGQERYLCSVVNLDNPSQVAITRYDFFNHATVHHAALFQPIVPEPEGVTDCPVLIKQTWLPLGGGGVSTSGLVLPSGAGMKLPGKSQILVQLHLLNSTSQPITARSFVNLTFAPDASQVTPAGIFAFGQQNFELAPGAKGVTLGSECMLGKTLDVFAVFPHMHQLGTKITLERGTSATDASIVYKRDPWVFGDQPMDQMTLKLGQGEYVRATCTYDNTTDRKITFGESSTDEMCYLVLFYTPFDHLDGCVR